MGLVLKSTLLVTLMRLDVISFHIISIGSHTGHHKSLHGLEASLAVFCDTAVSNSVAFYIKFTY